MNACPPPEHIYTKALSLGLRVIGVEGLLKAVAGTRGHFVHTYKEKPEELLRTGCIR